jgi:Spy/CpxP family protein refolding chaperone
VVDADSEDEAMWLNTVKVLALTGSLAGATCAVCTATPRARELAPPSAAELGLAGADATRWNALRDETIDARTSTRAAVLRETDTLRTLLASNAPDLDAYEREIEHAIDGHVAAERELRQKKLAFYDSLAPDQQAKLRAAMLDRLNRLERLRQAWLDATGSP